MQEVSLSLGCSASLPAPYGAYISTHYIEIEALRSLQTYLSTNLHSLHNLLPLAACCSAAGGVHLSDDTKTHRRPRSAPCDSNPRYLRFPEANRNGRWRLSASPMVVLARLLRARGISAWILSEKMRRRLNAPHPGETRGIALFWISDSAIPSRATIVNLRYSSSADTHHS